MLLNLSGNDSFGTHGDPIRTQIGHTVHNWKKHYKNGNYESKVLKLLQVQPAASRKDKDFEETKKPSKKTQSPPDSSESSSESDISEVMDIFKNISLSEKKFASPPAKQISVDKKLVPETPMTPVLFNDIDIMAGLPPNTSKFPSLYCYIVTFNLRY